MKSGASNLFLSICVSFVAHCSLSAQPGSGSGVAMKVDWSAFLAQHDLLWQVLPPAWNAGAFVGNGDLGMVIFAPADDTIEFHVGREDVTDHRGAPDKKTSAWTPGTSPHYSFPRLDVGRLNYHPAGKIVSGTMRQALWDAEVEVDLKTTLGSVHLRAFTDAVRMVQVIDLQSSEKDANGTSVKGRWEFVPGIPEAPRRMVFPNEAAGTGYDPNPAAQLNTMEQPNGAVRLVVQPLLAGGDYATAWMERTRDAGSETVYVTTANDVPKSGRSAPDALETLRLATALSDRALTQEHRAWWHAFYPAAFLSIPDERMEAFYWIQLYKLASASRAGGDLVDDDGPWFRINQWPYATWNLNVQLTYWLAYTSNHLELGDSLIEYVDRNFDAMLRWSGGKPDLGNLAWVMHNYWWQARYAGDKTMLDREWFPKASRVASSYLKMLQEGSDGRLHLPAMQSPEYPRNGSKLPGFADFRDSSYNLALLRWLLQTLIATAAQIDGKSNEAAKWARALDQLAPLPVGPDGIQIGSDQLVDISHRHFSHLLSVYPLYEVGTDAQLTRDLVNRSIVHWQTVNGGSGLAGYSFTGAAKLYSALNDGDNAEKMLNTFLGEVKGISRLYPNTFYGESGGRNPVIETPLSAASAMQDLLLQSHAGTLQVFLSTPSGWQDAVFYHLRTEGAFLVSARRRGGRTVWVEITSLKGEAARVEIAGWPGAGETVVRGAAAAIKPISSGTYAISLRAGETASISLASEPAPEILPLSHPAATLNPYGLRAGMPLDFGATWPEVMPARHP